MCKQIYFPVDIPLYHDEVSPFTFSLKSVFTITNIAIASFFFFFGYCLQSKYFFHLFTFDILMYLYLRHVPYKQPVYYLIQPNNISLKASL